LLLIAAIIEFMGGLADLPILLGDLSQIPGPGLGGAIIIAKIALQPLLALAALFFLIRGHLTYSLLAMAFIILMTWLNYLPSVALHGLGSEAGGVGALFTFLLILLPPFLVVAIAGLALTGKQLTLATLLAIVPTLVSVLSVIAFAIGVGIYGF